MLPYNKNLKYKARELRLNMTKAEKKLWYELLAKDRLNGFRFLRQKPIDNYIADFYCHKLKLVIEIDGESHLSVEAKEYDVERTNVLNAYGIEVIRFTNEKIMNHFDKVKNLLQNLVENKKYCNPPAPLSPFTKGAS